jgi:hypothetical protein
MKKLLLSGIAAATLMVAGTTQASDLSLMGDTGVARTPIAMALAPMQFAVAADYVAADAFGVPVRAEVGLPYNIELGGAYWYMDLDGTTIWSINGKWVLPPFVENLSLAIGGHYKSQEIGNFDNDGDDLYAVATYVAPMGEGMSIIPSFGVMWDQRTGDNSTDVVRWFGSLIFKAPQFAIAGEYQSVDDEMDGANIDGNYWLGGRFYLNPMITLQAGYLNNVNWSNDKEDITDGVWHIGAQFAFSSGK